LQALSPQINRLPITAPIRIERRKAAAPGLDADVFMLDAPDAPSRDCRNRVNTRPISTAA
jgi:hypothetical protein